MSLRVAVTAASGKTGQAVAAGMRSAGGEVVAIGRSSDPGFALRGCDAVYLIAPNLHADETDHIARLLDAAREARVARAVYHSVAAPYAPAMPHHLAKAVSEDLVRRSGLEWTILQPCAYVQNFVPALLSGTSLDVAYSTQTRFGLVDLVDVGAAAAAVLADRGHAGATYELGGPELVSVSDVAAAAGRVTGRTYAARRIPLQEWDSGAGAALPEREAQWLRAMFAYYDSYGLPAGGVPLQALLGRPSTPLLDTLRRELG